MTLIDVNASYGPWPFAPLGCESARALDRHLGAQGIDQALVSSLRSVFYTDPHQANQSLLREVCKFSRLLPVPTLNPSLPNSLQLLDRYDARHRIFGIKLYPNYHRFSLSSPRCRALCEKLETMGLPLLINFRLEDERFHYRGLRIGRVSIDQTAELAQRFPDLPLLCLGLYEAELKQLSRQSSSFRADMSFADWHRLIPRLLAFLRPEQLLFGSATPLLVTEANRRKLEAAPIAPALKKQIASENARTFFPLA